MDVVVYDKIRQESDKIYNALLGMYPQETITDVAIASLSDGADGIPIKSLVCEINPVQSGTGDPSPQNIRPISGHTGLTLSHSGEDTSDPTTLSIPWQSTVGTVYGGTLDVTTGALTVTHVNYQFPTETTSWTVESTSGGLLKLSTNLPSSKNVGAIYLPDIKCSYYKTVNNNSTVNSVFHRHDNVILVLDLTEFPNRSRYINYLNTLDVLPTVCYELATPLAYQLGAHTVETLQGQNNIWHDCNGNIKKLTYRADLGMYITKDAIANYLCLSGMIAGVESGMIASKAYNSGDYFIVGTTLYRATASISNGATFTPGTNCTETTVGAELTTFNT